MSNSSRCSSTCEGSSSLCDDKCPKNSTLNTDHSANGPAFCGSGTNLNETSLGRAIPEPLRDDLVRKRSPSIFRCFRLPSFRKSTPFSRMRQESPREASTIIEQSGKVGICTIDSANTSPSVSNLTIGDSLLSDPLEHAPNMWSVRPLISCAQFSRRRNSLSTTTSAIPMIETQTSIGVKGYHQRCHNSTVMKLQAMPVNKEDESDLNQTVPVITEEITLTMDESKRVLRASQEFLAGRHFPTRICKDLDGRARKKSGETMTKDEPAVCTNDSVNGEDRESIKSSETFRQISMERPSADDCEARGFIMFSGLIHSLGRAIEFLEQKEVQKLEEIATDIDSAKMEIGHADCLRSQLVKTREMIETRLAVASSVPEVDQKGSPTESQIAVIAPCTSPNGPSRWPLTNSPNSPKYDSKCSPIISPIHSGTSTTSPNSSSHRLLLNSMNQDDGSPGSKKMQRTRRPCIPSTKTANWFSEQLSTKSDSRRTPDTKRSTLKSTPWRPLGNRSFSNNQLLDVMPVGVHNSNCGTTCYINAGLQLLSSVPEILYRVEDGIQFWILKGNSDLEACVAYRKFMEDRGREISKPIKQRTSIKNCPIADMMFKIYPDKFKAYEEEDCVEFVTLLLLKIHEELGEALSPIVLFTGTQRRFRTKASRATGREGDGENSFNSPPLAKEEFNVIPLHFTARHGTIEDSFDSYTTEEQSSDEEFLHWCKFEVLPRLLLVHVQSYDDSKPIPQKALRVVPIDEILQFRQEWMYEDPRAAEVPVPSDDSFGILISDDLERDCASKQVLATPPRYQLRAVVFHDGCRTTTGHYTAAVFLPDKFGRKVWYYCDDQFVKGYSRRQLNCRSKISQVTLLLYERNG